MQGNPIILKAKGKLKKPCGPVSRQFFDCSVRPQGILVEVRMEPQDHPQQLCETEPEGFGFVPLIKAPSWRKNFFFLGGLVPLFDFLSVVRGQALLPCCVTVEASTMHVVDVKGVDIFTMTCHIRTEVPAPFNRPVPHWSGGIQEIRWTGILSRS